MLLSAGAPLLGRPAQVPRRSHVTPGHAHAPSNGPLLRRGLGLFAPAPALPVQALQLPVPPLPPLPTALLCVAGAIAGVLLLRVLGELEARRAEREQAAYDAFLEAWTIRGLPSRLRPRLEALKGGQFVALLRHRDAAQALFCDWPLPVAEASLRHWGPASSVHGLRAAAAAAVAARASAACAARARPEALAVLRAAEQAWRAAQATSARRRGAVQDGSWYTQYHTTASFPSWRPSTAANAN